MTAFEKWAAGILDVEDPDYNIHEREYYVAGIFTNEQLKERWDKIGYTPPEPKQLKLF